MDKDEQEENEILFEWIKRNYGPRCKDHEPECKCCQAWEYYDWLKFDEDD